MVLSRLGKLCLLYYSGLAKGKKKRIKRFDLTKTTVLQMHLVLFHVGFQNKYNTIFSIMQIHQDMLAKQ